MKSELIRKASAYAQNVFSDESFKNRPFHNLEHTLAVVAAAEEIGSRTELSDDEMESAVIAAWLHDVGYLEGEGDHELKAAERARELLRAWGASNPKIQEVTEAILATRPNVSAGRFTRDDV